MTTIKHLDWDSEFFGYPVGLLTLEKEVVDEDRLRSEARGFKVVYVTSETPQKSSFLYCGDKKITFGKTPENHRVDFDVVEISSDEMSEAVKLGLYSGIWSRFALDKRFDNQEYERMYAKWVERSVQNEIAYKALTVQVDGKPSGIITLAQTMEHQSTIGIFAVAPECRGKGIGSKLIKSVDTLCFQRGDSLITVATQGKNKTACDVYVRLGFELISETYIYNYWNEAFTTVEQITSQ